MRISLALMAVLFLCCEHYGEIYDMKYVGKVLDASAIPTSFNEGSKTQVKTDSMFMVIVGYPYLRIGDSAFVVRVHGRSSRRLYQRNCDCMYRIYDY